MTRTPACVLVLDADEATRALYQRSLSRIWRVVGCASEAEASLTLKRVLVDALVIEPATLVDANWSFLRRLHARKSRGENMFPVVICSTLDQRRLGAELGVAAYLIKPVSPQLLQTTLREVLASPMQNTSTDSDPDSDSDSDTEADTAPASATDSAENHRL
jgi:response regulator RpfG family c-di-GMP phosphodiesterase